MMAGYEVLIMEKLVGKTPREKYEYLLRLLLSHISLQHQHLDKSQLKDDKVADICSDCAVNPGEAHLTGCDVERCSVCGGQRLQCECEGHDSQSARWTGIWPDLAKTKK